MLEDEKYLNKDEINLRLARILVWAVLGVVFILFTSMSSCVMYLNSVEAEQTRAETEQIKEKNELEKEKIDAISVLIDKGTNPIAARCAIKGYTIAIHTGVVYDPCIQFITKDGKQGEELR